ncbi:ChrR family anti-sigma-E factor [Aliiglaciecola sp. CAU 1673]|uniref:ChrR family anti-sigma-E factor n=1 Tax=Aliiglaciecola sp. CAU 1673 TaxID=3032595 RepID=UPI0023DA4AFD|nr:ChrR family anti-sigma-E factor [Aliiglaciecola sp. CAU 1673]MDF2178203.1 ChrR family anti-sigma-E factor [Aliiglaciecola sp. CAU 1673]
MIKHHPTHELLSAFAAGNCSPAQALILSAHVDMCPRCRQLTRAQEDCLAEKAFAHSAQTDEAFDLMLQNITRLPQQQGESVAPTHQVLTLDGREFKLPRALQRYASKVDSWSHTVGKLWQAKVDLGAQGRADFIYMENGGSVPEHTHRGSELTLVLDGEFSDGVGTYETGDFLSLGAEHTHAPRSDVEEGCLVFSIVDKPLHFTSGWARLLNPFSHLFFK